MEKTFIRCYNIALKLWVEFNAKFVLLYFSSYSSIKRWHFFLKDVEKNKAVHLRLVLTYLFKTFSRLRNILPGHSKKLPIYFSVYSKQMGRGWAGWGNPPYTGLSLLSSKKLCNPQVTQIFLTSYLPVNKGWEGSNYDEPQWYHGCCVKRYCFMFVRF